MNRPAAGQIIIKLYERTLHATWRVVGTRVEVTSHDLGVESAPLGPLASAPATAARETLVDMAKRAYRPVKPRVDNTRFDIRDA